MSRFFRAIATLGGLATLLASCSQVLGIEDGHLDSTIGAPVAGGGTGGALGASTAGTGGSLGGAQALDTAGGPPESKNDGGAPTAAGSSSAADGGSTGGEPATEPLSLCDEYCTKVMSGCTEEQAQYIDFAACQASCADFAAGEPGARTGNTIHCRLTYAEKAPSEPYTYCTWAGPGGDGKCGTNCEGFCTIMMQTCRSETTDEPDEYFDSLSECQSTCEALDDVGAYSATNSDLQIGADHVQCRLYHVGAAIAEDDPITHCGHAMGHSLCLDTTH